MSDSTAIFRQACLAEVNFRIRNQVVVNRLTTTSSKITKISWWEMLVNCRWIWNFRPTSIGKHLLPCAIDFKTNHPPIHLQWIGILGMSTESRHIISMGPRTSPWWGNCQQHQIACEGLFYLNQCWNIVDSNLRNKLYIAFVDKITSLKMADEILRNIVCVILTVGIRVVLRIMTLYSLKTIRYSQHKSAFDHNAAVYSLGDSFLCQ